MYKQESARDDRFVTVTNPSGGTIRMLLPRQNDGGWLYSQEMLDKIAMDHGSVLITGETGTGKELLAYYLHNQSKRSKMPFVAVNCTGLTQERMQGELFGWEKGGFTGADKSYDGKLLQAQGGTIFLDEIAVMDKLNQARLLRFMQTGEIEPIGKRTVKADVRVIAATNRPVRPASTSSDFIPDLFYRFRFNNLTLPALRDRQSDVFRLLLEPEFLGNQDVFTGITIPTLLMLAAQDWLGNIRELQHYCDDLRLFGTPATVPGSVASHDHKRYTPLPNYILHDTRLFESRLDWVPFASGLEFCVRKAADCHSVQKRRWWKEFLNTATLLWSLRKNGMGRRYESIREEHIVSFATLREELEYTEHKVWGSFDFPGWWDMFSGPAMMLPVSWRHTECDLADAIANAGYCCRLLRVRQGRTANIGHKDSSTTVTETFSKMEVEDYWEREIHHAIDVEVYEEGEVSVAPTRLTIQEFEADLEKQDVHLPLLPLPQPPPTSDSTVEKLLVELNLGNVRRHEPSVIRQVLRLYSAGYGPTKIQRCMNGQLTTSQIKGIERTWGEEFKPRQKPVGGRTPLKNSARGN